VIVAPSAGGKTTVIRRLMAGHPDLVHSISCTTRPARPGRVDEGYYEMLTDADFRAGIAAGRFAEWAEVHGYLYGTPRAPLDAWLDEGRDVVLDLDVVGALALKAAFPGQAVTVFLLPPSIDELERRLATRGTDSPAVRAVRLANALKEIESADRFDFRVVNDDLDRCCREVEGILYGQAQEEAR
jgi:guanylate kinase